MKKGFKYLLSCGCVIFLILLGVGAVLYFVAPERYNILVIGCDRRGEERARSDVLMVVSVPKTPAKPISVVTVPRDSRVEIPGHGLDKITHAYVYGEETEGDIGNKDLTLEAIEGVLDVPIHGTLEITFESFKDIVDMMGGIEGEGGELMDGEEALLLVRNRYRPGGDFARTEDQRNIFLGLLSKMKSKTQIQMVYEYLNTSDKASIDFDKMRLAHFAYGTGIRRMGKMDIGETANEFLPGHGDYLYAENFGQNLYFWIIDEAGKNELVERLLK